MPRLVHPPTTLRNRNRITNKYRLKIIHGNIDTDPVIPDEDDEKNRSNLAVAGVDQEDANEHHLLAVLSEAQRTYSSSSPRSTRNAHEKKPSAATIAYIPTPDSTGVVDGYELLYPADRWKDPVSYVASSLTVEDTTDYSLAHDCTYYMDERDKEWLDKNNEEARGEGTSVQGAIASTSGMRASARSSKAKGKEPEQGQPVALTEDEFELVVGLFEQITHEKTEHLHLSLGGMPFPAFSEYQDAFSSTLPASRFDSFVVPSWLPSPSNLVRMARAVYPHWKERRLEREGRRIMPMLNGDENDLPNESYVCFRRREIKAVRKTRAQQTSSSEKFLRLQGEFAYPFDLAQAVLAREMLKAESARHSQSVWEKRMAVADVKRKFPTLVEKADEELLHDKERPSKRQETSRAAGLKLRTPHESTIPAPRPEPMIRPHARAAMIQSRIEIELSRQKDHGWDDGVSSSFQAPPVPISSRSFKFGAGTGHALSPCAVRLRRGRGGRMLVDRRLAAPYSPSTLRSSRSSLFGSPHDNDEEDPELVRRLEERWRFDADDCPDGSDEQDRVLVDEFDAKYLRHSGCLLTDNDQQGLNTDTTLHFNSAEGREIVTVPGFKLGLPHFPRQASHGVLRSYPMISQQGLVNGTPIANQVKKMASMGSHQHLRISANGGMRPPSLPPSQSGQTSPQPATPNPVRAPITVPHLQVESVPDGLIPTHSPAEAANILQPHTSETTNNMNGMNGSGVPTRPKSQNTHLPSNYLMMNGTMTNGAMNGYLANGSPYLGSTSSLSIQQMQNLKSAFANTHSGMDPHTVQNNISRQPQVAVPGYNVHAGTFNMAINPGTNINLKLPPNRQLNWSAPMRPNSANGLDHSALSAALNGAMNGMGNGMGNMHSMSMNGNGNVMSGNLVNGSSSLNGAMGMTLPGSLSPTPNHHPVPVRTPSANGSHNGMSMSMSPPHMQLSPSPHLHHTPSPMQSPPRQHMAPMQLGSPALTHQQPVGGFQNVY